MALQSQLFRGDPKLESAAELDSAHVTLRAHGAHVGKIQQALNLLDGAGIAEDSVYGPATADAVVRFKRKRRILGPSQTQPDNIVGKLTMAALDREMLTKEKAPGPKLNLSFGIQADSLRQLLGDRHFGVDTSFRASAPLKNKSGVAKTMFEVVSEELAMPEFWGRYLFPSKDKKLGVTSLDAKEVSFIRAASDGKCKILLIANFGPNQFHDANPARARQKGRNCALGAIAKCNALKVPTGVWVYVDIEQNFTCSTNFFLGWFDEMQKAGRGRGGCYADPLQFPFSSPYRAALRATLNPVLKAINPDPPAFLPDPPSSARLLWSISPNVFHKVEVDSNRFLPGAFGPSRLLFAPAQTVLWQYGADCRVLKGNTSFVVDLNIATAQGFNSMWKP